MMKASAQGRHRSPAAANHRVVVTRHGGPEVLQLVETDLPEPGAGEVRVKVSAAGISAYDLMHRRSGALPGVPRVPFTPGEDVVGMVHLLGTGVSGLEEGQTVAGYPRGGARHIWRSHRALRRGGRLISYGMAATSKRGMGVIPLTVWYAWTWI